MTRNLAECLKSIKSQRFIDISADRIIPKARILENQSRSITRISDALLKTKESHSKMHTIEEGPSVNARTSCERECSDLRKSIESFNQQLNTDCTLPLNASSSPIKNFLG